VDNIRLKATASSLTNYIHVACHPNHQMILFVFYLLFDASEKLLMLLVCLLETFSSLLEDELVFFLFIL